MVVIDDCLRWAYESCIHLLAIKTGKTIISSRHLLFIPHLTTVNFSNSWKSRLQQQHHLNCF